MQRKSRFWERSGGKCHVNITNPWNQQALCRARCRIGLFDQAAGTGNAGLSGKVSGDVWTRSYWELSRTRVRGRRGSSEAAAAAAAMPARGSRWGWCCRNGRALRPCRRAAPAGRGLASRLGGRPSCRRRTRSGEKRGLFPGTRFSGY